jgi:hypothetical protein
MIAEAQDLDMAVLKYSDGNHRDRWLAVELQDEADQLWKQIEQMAKRVYGRCTIDQIQMEASSST